ALRLDAYSDESGHPFHRRWSFQTVELVFSVKLASLPTVTYSWRGSTPVLYASPDRQIAVDLGALGHFCSGSAGHLRRIASRLLQAKTAARPWRAQLCNPSPCHRQP